MIGQRSTNRQFFVSALWLAIAAMVLRAFVPAGWMPNTNGLSNGAPIVICSGSGAQTILMDQDGKPVQPTNPTDHGICVFAASGPLSLPLTILVLALLVFAVGTQIALPQNDRIEVGRRLFGGAGPRAPPANLPA